MRWGYATLGKTGWNGTRKTKPGAYNSPGWRSGEVAVTLRPRPLRDCSTLIRLARSDVSRPPPGRFRAPPRFDAHAQEMVACGRYHRFTLPRRDTVMVATRVPRRNTTVVLDSPHARPIGSNTTTGFDTSRATPCRSGPGQRCRSP